MLFTIPTLFLIPDYANADHLSVSRYGLRGEGSVTSPHSVPDLSVNNEFTVEMWVLHGGSETTTVMDSDNVKIELFVESAFSFANLDKFIINVTVAAVRFSIQTTDGWKELRSHGFRVNYGIWSHVAVTWDGEEMAILVDGIVTATDTHTGELLPTNYLRMGFRRHVGILDEVRMWNIVRSGGDIVSSSSVPISAQEAGMVAYWRFDEGSGASATEAGFRHRLALSEDAWFESNIPDFHSAISTITRMHLNSTVYHCSDEIQVEVSDLDLAEVEEISVNFNTRSGGDSARLDLARDSIIPGLFRGSMPTSSEDVDNRDGILQVVDGETFTAKYTPSAQTPLNLGSVEASALIDCSEPDGIVFVSHDAEGTGNGSSWENAFTSINEAIQGATPDAEIWVKSDIYLEAILLDKPVNLYGGFAGTENPNEKGLRDWVELPTTIEALWMNQPGVRASSGGILDGFRITNARVYGAGGGIVCDPGASPTIRHCKIFENASAGLYCFIDTCPGGTGGGILMYDASPTFEHCIISDNFAGEVGGGVSCYQNSSPTFVNCLFYRNSGISFSFGSAILSSNSSPSFHSCTFANNSGRGFYVIGVFSIEIVSSIIWEHEPIKVPPDPGGPEPMVLDVTYSNIKDGFPGVGNIDSEPLFRGERFGDLRLQPNSPCIDTGASASAIDLDGVMRPVDIPGIGPDGTGNPHDMGAYEYPLAGYPTYTPTSSPTVTATPTVTPTFTPTHTKTQAPHTHCLTDFTITCNETDFTSNPFLNSEPFSLRLFEEIETLTGCEVVSCPTSEAIVECSIDCAEQGEFTTCFGFLQNLQSTIDACISANTSLSFFSSDLLGSNRLSISVGTPSDCRWCICSQELGLPCGAGQGLPLGPCAISNLCDGVTGNEFDPAVDGISIGSVTTLYPTPTPIPGLLFDRNMDGGVDALDLITVIEEEMDAPSSGVNTFIHFSLFWTREE